MKRLTLMIALFSLLVAGSALAMKGSADVVKVKPATANLSAAAGERIDFEVKVDIDKTWHLYAHGDSNFIGIDLVPVEGCFLKDLKVEYPHGHEGEFFGEKVMMISGSVAIKGNALVPADTKAGQYEQGFTVTAQACDDKTCLPPADLPLSFKLTVK